MSNSRRIDDGRFIVRAFAAKTAAHTDQAIHPEAFVSAVVSILHYHLYMGSPDRRTTDELLDEALRRLDAELDRLPEPAPVGPVNVWPDGDEPDAGRLALHACAVLSAAYENGAARGGSMRWEEVDEAHEAAVVALDAENSIKGES